MGWIDLASEYSLHFETGGTFGLIPYFCTLNVYRHIGHLIIFEGTSQILGVKTPFAKGKWECCRHSV